MILGDTIPSQKFTKLNVCAFVKFTAVMDNVLVNAFEKY